MDVFPLTESSPRPDGAVESSLFILPRVRLPDNLAGQKLGYFQFFLKSARIPGKLYRYQEVRNLAAPPSIGYIDGFAIV